MKKIILAWAFIPAVAFAGLQVVEEPASQPKLSPGLQAALNITVQSQPIASAPLQIKPIAIKPKEVWVAEAGSTLRDTIQTWAAKAKWTIVWDSKMDFPLRGPLRFEGRFDEAVAQFITMYEQSDKPLVADISLQQSLIYVTNRK